MTGDSSQKLGELLAREQVINILVRKDPDIDTMAGALALFLSLEKTGKQVSIVCPSEPIVEISSLVGIDKVGRAFKGANGRDLTLILPYEKGKIDKISYNIEGDKIHLVVKAGPQGLGFDKNDIEFVQSGEAQAKVILVGVSNPAADLGDLYREEFASGEDVINISGSENITFALQQLGLPVDIDIAQNLLSGIISATDNFQNAKTEGSTFEAAAFLMKYGAKRQALQPQETKEVDVKTQDVEKTPPDWLTPKIYKGSTLP